jgi:hypothetical protein
MSNSRDAVKYAIIPFSDYKNRKDFVVEKEAGLRHSVKGTDRVVIKLLDKSKVDITLSSKPYALTNAQIETNFKDIKFYTHEEILKELDTEDWKHNISLNG